ncbi:MAG TPA: carboxypeptidase regulatory-like domain-containing protein [Pyrinomonadaceae bacterium]|nr:carboxypeptidase regulatory-like domain-containing protein [Pyrinomonadaceae bacterium]
MRRARPFDGDLRQLPQERPVKAERPEREEPELNPEIFVPPSGAPETAPKEQQSSTAVPNLQANAPAPPPSANFEGLDFNNWGNGHPPDTVGDVGPNYYIQAINTSLGVYDKATGTRVAAFSFNTFMSQGTFGNLCDTNNFGDPVVLYDTFEDRWVVTDFAFKLSSGNVVSPPGAFQCFAVSKTGDPVAGGWNFYSVQVTDFLNDYPKFGIWPDGIYMSANLFGFPAGSSFAGPRVWALNKSQMYAGAASIQVVSFDGPTNDFTLLPSNARLQTGTPPTGTPNYFMSTSRFLNAVTVYKFHVDWDHIGLSTFTGPDIPIAATSWPNSTAPAAPSLGGNNLDSLATRAMMQNQYTNIAGAESLWVAHTVRRASTPTDLTGFSAPRYYQVPVTSGTVGPTITQAATYDPDGANVMYRFMPSVAVDRAGNMALGYSTSNSTTKPAIKYAGRLATDPLNTITQTEQVLIQGNGTQVGNCGGSPCTRWGDYSAMSLDPDGCTFWYTNMYYPVDGLDHHTRIGSFTLPQCTTVGSGSIQGTVTSSVGGGPIGGATVNLGNRTATTDPGGFYSFTGLPAGTYPNMTATFPGYTSASANNVVVNEAAITTRNFVLSPGANNACLTDTTQTDFQRGVGTSVDLAGSPGDVSLANPATLDQQNTSVTNSGFGFNVTSWAGQTFQPAVTGQLTRADLDLFCASCTGTAPNVIVSVRATSGDLPTGGDLATATITGFNSGSAVFYSANFASPPTLIAGTRYALVFRPVANPSAGTYAYVVSTGNSYANGRWVASGNAGVTWAAGPAPSRELGFRTFMRTGFVPSGNLVSGTFDANPHAGGAVTWTTLSWTGSTPAGTTLRFQVAASNSRFGPFNFVGPDTTAATFFTTSGASLSQFNGLRYLKYKAYLATTNGAVTPTLNDVTVCFTNTVPITLTVNSATGTYGGTVNLSATLTDGVSPLSGATLNFTLNGNGAGSGGTDGSGVATVSNASLAGINANTYPNGVGTSFAGDATYIATSATNTLTVNRADATINVTPYNVPYDGNPHTATGTATGVNSESLSGLNLSGTTHTNAGNYTGDGWTFADVTGNYNNASGTVDDVITGVGSTTTVTVSNANYDGNPHGGSAQVTGAGGLNQSLPVTYTGRNTTVYGPSGTPPTNAGDYTAGASYAGDANHSGSSDSKDYSIFKASSLTTVICPASVVFTGSPLTPCTASATGAGGLNVSLSVSYANNVNPGTATASASYPGDNNHTGSSGAATFTITAPPFNFVIGDNNAIVGNHVTFWGAQWATKNSLSGGAAPASFKGFANSTSTTPAECGGAWTSDPGNSSGPPAAIPEFITVIVSSSVTKNGSILSGNNRKLVIVKIDPGYGPSPGGAGTGTVYSVVCQ